jgi:hypothetical protein
MKSINLKQGLLRISITLLVAWVAFVVYFHWTDYCAVYSQPLSALNREKDIAEAKKSIEKYRAEGKDPPGIDVLNLRLMEGSLRDGHPATECFGASWDAESAPQAGGWAVNWDKFKDFTKLLLGPPLVLVLAGILLMWIAKGFRHKA